MQLMLDVAHTQCWVPGGSPTSTLRDIAGKNVLPLRGRGSEL